MQWPADRDQQRRELGEPDLRSHESYVIPSLRRGARARDHAAHVEDRGAKARARRYEQGLQLAAVRQFFLADVQ